MSATIRKVADMAGDNHDDKTQEEPQVQENLGHEQAQEEQSLLELCDDISRLNVGAASEWNIGIADALQLRLARGRKRHGVRC